MLKSRRRVLDKVLDELENLKVTRLRNVHINNFYVGFSALRSVTSWKQDTKKKLVCLNPKVTVNN